MNAAAPAYRLVQTYVTLWVTGLAILVLGLLVLAPGLAAGDAQSLPGLLVMGACVGGYWQPKYSVPNAAMVEAVQMLARTEAILLDPVYTGKIMAGLIGMARQGALQPGERVLFLHTGGMPSLFAYREVLLG